MKTKLCALLAVLLPGILLGQAPVDRTRMIVNARTLDVVRSSIQNERDPLVLRASVLSWAEKATDEKKRNAELEAKSEELKRRVEAYAATIKAQEATVASAKEELRLLEAQRANLIEEGKVLEKQQAELAVAIQAAKAKNDVLTAQNTGLATLNQQLTNEVEVSRSAARRLEGQIGVLKTEQRGLEEQIMSAKAETQKASEDVVEIGDKFMKSVIGLITLLLSTGGTAVTLVITIRSARLEERKKEAEIGELQARLKVANA